MRTLLQRPWHARKPPLQPDTRRRARRASRFGGQLRWHARTAARRLPVTKDAATAPSPGASLRPRRRELRHASQDQRTPPAYHDVGAKDKIAARWRFLSDRGARGAVLPRVVQSNNGAFWNGVHRLRSADSCDRPGKHSRRDPCALVGGVCVVSAAGLAFLFAGMTVVFQALPVSGGFHWAASFLLLLCLALPFNWVAFGPGERQFTSTTTAGAGSQREPVSESEGRIVFGLAALLVNALAVAAVVKAFRCSPSPKPDGTLPLEEATTLPAPHRLRPHPPPRAVR